MSTTYNICREAEAIIVTAEKPSMKTIIYETSAQITIRVFMKCLQLSWRW